MLTSTGSAVKIYRRGIIGSVKRHIFQTLIQFVVILSVLYHKIEMKLKVKDFSISKYECLACPLLSLKNCKGLIAYFSTI